MRTTNRGFTLVEILVSTAVFAIFMIGILNLLDTSTKVSQVETELTDTQENVRFATYHIMRTARMMGGGGIPFAGSTAGGDKWAAGELISNPSSSSVYVPGYGTVDVLPGSDVLTLRGFFEISPFFCDPDRLHSGAHEASIYQINLVGESVNDLDAFTDDNLVGRGIVFMGKGMYSVGEITGADVTGEDTTRRLVIDYDAGDELWPDLNITNLGSYPPGPLIYRVGVLDSYTYFVDDRHWLMRLRVGAGNPDPEPVAIDIGGLQVALGIDANNDHIIQEGEWEKSPANATAVAGANVVAMRITVLGRTETPVSGWLEPSATFNAEDGSLFNVDRGAKWRRMQVVVNLRNYKF
jgi:prepilin-type N-terminal cleavage/methylation domain-containing protein